MNNFIKKHFSVSKVIWIIFGAIAGFLYYRFIGCKSGQCAITSNAYISILYGSILGYLLADIFKSKSKK